MTKKDFIAMAEVVKEISNLEERYKVAKKMCEVFKNDNPLFNENRFLKAADAQHPLKK